MNLPEPVARAFAKSRKTDPIVSARCLYPLGGGLGQTYVAADQRGLLMFSQPLNQPPTQRSLDWTEVTKCSLRQETAFTFLELRTAKDSLTLAFSPWQGAQLQRMIDLWQAASPSVPSSARTSNPPPPSLSPLVALCAAVHAMIQCDQRVEPSELNFLTARIPDPEAIQLGQQFLQNRGLPTLCQCLGQVLNETQRRCLLANLMGVSMVDGELQSEEQTLLEQFQTALQIPEAESKALFQALLTKNNLTVFAGSETGSMVGDQDGLTPLMAYCASLLALMACDQDTLPTEEQLLTVTVPYPDDINLGRDYLAAYGIDHLLARLPQVLDHPQRLCLTANLMALVMIDGLIRTAEQILLDRFLQAMAIPQTEQTALNDALLTKNNLAVFADLHAG